MEPAQKRIVATGNAQIIPTTPDGKPLSTRGEHILLDLKTQSFEVE